MHLPADVAKTGLPISTQALRPGREAYLDAANARTAKKKRREAEEGLLDLAEILEQKTLSLERNENQIMALIETKRRDREGQARGAM